MNNLPFVIWMLGWPLVATVGYKAFLEDDRHSYQSAPVWVQIVYGQAALIMWLLIGWMVFG